MIRIYTDGSSRHANGVWYGAYAVVVYEQDKAITQIVQCVKPGTNNACEMIAVLRAITIAREKYKDKQIEVVTDSQYVVNGFASNTPYKSNPKLWEIMRNLVNDIDIKFTWVKGHHKDTKNKHVDHLSHTALKQYFRQMESG